MCDCVIRTFVCICIHIKEFSFCIEEICVHMCVKFLEFEPNIKNSQSILLNLNFSSFSVTLILSGLHCMTVSSGLGDMAKK